MVGYLKEMGYDAELQDTPYTKGKRAGEPRCEVHLKTGKPVNVFMDLLNEDAPQFRSFANYKLDGIAERQGYKQAKWIEGREGGIEKYNREQGFQEGLKFKGPMMAAYCAAFFGIPLQQISDAFRLQRKGKGADAEAEADMGEGFDAATDFAATATDKPEAAPARPRPTTSATRPR